ncbi:PLD nuclease N-terminal domain-containing protein [Amycolatopsis sp. NBC_00355]|uniref:PLD nuclease N-terminal domain-containing protein n=1 Tax=Amycolatopsis sp. NBC_00355 TaxID=2975957 RepID=UPI002E258042
MTHREWRDVPSSRRAAIAVAGTVQVALAASAWWDLSRRPADQVRGPKWLWSLAIAVNFAGPIAYFTAGRVPPRATDAGQSGQDISPDATAIASALAGVPSTPAAARLWWCAGGSGQPCSPRVTVDCPAFPGGARLRSRARAPRPVRDALRSSCRRAR